MTQARLGALPDGIYGQELERRIDQAANAIRDSLRQHPDLEAPRLAIVLGSGLGDVVERSGDVPRARQLFRRVADADPSFADVQSRIRALR